MIKGSFTSATGVIDIEFMDGNEAVVGMEITQIGELSYSFDITPESVTIDRLLALYSNFKFNYNSINELGDDVYELMVDSLVTNVERAVNLVITTHEGERFEFKFSAIINDLQIDERTGIASLLCKPLVKDLTFKDVFDAIPNDQKRLYLKSTIKSGTVSYPSVGVATWIEKAISLLFDNTFPIDFVPSKSGLGSNYSQDVYAKTVGENIGRNMFALLNMGEGFVPIEEGETIQKFTGTATIQYRTVNVSVNPITGEPIEITRIEVNGVGTNFNIAKIGDPFYYFNGTIPIRVGTIGSIPSNEKMFLNIEADSIFENAVEVGYGESKLPNQRPALDVLKELAGIEGSVFGSGFSRNFYINRLADTQNPIPIDYDNVINAKLNRTSLYLGDSVVTQLGVQTRGSSERVKKRKSFWDKLFGRQRFSTETTPLPDDPYGTYPSTDGDSPDDDREQDDIANRQLPVLNRVTSFNIGNSRASKELRIELAPAYPLLSKGLFTQQQTFVEQGQIGDTALESALTSNGLRNYLRALSSVDGDFIIDYEIKGAFSIKPYETFTFTNAPSRYLGNVYRVSDIKYNLVNDTVKVKGYKINEFEVDIVPTSVTASFINISPPVQRFRWDTTKPVIQPLDIVATGVSGSIEVECSAGLYSINTDPTDNLWRSRIVLNTDGFGKVARRIYVRFSPSAAGIVSESLLYGVIEVTGGGRTARAELRGSVIAPQADFYIGQVTEPIGGDAISAIEANMFTEIEKGREFTLVGENKGNRYTITPTADVPTGISNIAIEEQFIEKDTYHVEVSQNADRTGITVSEREIVLKVKGDGTIASVRLSVDADDPTSSEINIIADQVKINDVRFERLNTTINTGLIESTNYLQGASGWRIDGTGRAEFENVVARGEIVAESGSIEGALTFGTNGVIQGGSSNFTYEIANTGILFNDITTASNVAEMFLSTRTFAISETVNTVSRQVVLDANKMLYQETTGFGSAHYGIDKLELFDTSDDGRNILVDSNGISTIRNISADGSATIGGTSTFNGLVRLNSVQQFDVEAGTISNTASVVLINDSGPFGFTYTLPSAIGVRRMLIIKDIAGFAGALPHTIQRQGGTGGSDLIDNSSTPISLDSNFGSITLMDTSSGNWSVISKI